MRSSLRQRLKERTKRLFGAHEEVHIVSAKAEMTILLSGQFLLFLLIDLQKIAIVDALSGTEQITDH